MTALTWFRSASYDIQNGAIVPARHAKLEPYDAWRAYQLARTGRRQRPAPYQSLLKLVTRARTDLSGTPSPETQDAACAWCSQHGPLGILMVSLPVEVLPPLPDYECIGDVSGGGRSVDPRALWRWGPVDRSWARFFREPQQQKAGRRSYPAPFSDGFWSDYQEPLRDFLGAGMRLLAGVEEIRQHLNGKAREGRRKSPAPLLLDALQSIARRHTIEVGASTFEHPWVFPSLMAGFAAMILDDVREGCVVRDCIECGTPFLSKAYQARFCDSTCRKTNLMRAYRQRRR